MRKCLILGVFLLMSCSQVYERSEEPSYTEIFQPWETRLEVPEYDIPDISSITSPPDPYIYGPILYYDRVYQIQHLDKLIATIEEKRIEERKRLEESQKEGK